MSKDIYIMISEVIKKYDLKNNFKLSIIKNNLPKYITYEQIKMVIKEE